MGRPGGRLVRPDRILTMRDATGMLAVPDFIDEREHLPIFERQRGNLVELRMLGGCAARCVKEELGVAVKALDQRIDAMVDRTDDLQVPVPLTATTDIKVSRTPQTT